MILRILDWYMRAAGGQEPDSESRGKYLQIAIYLTESPSKKFELHINEIHAPPRLEALGELTQMIEVVKCICRRFPVSVYLKNPIFVILL